MTRGIEPLPQPLQGGPFSTRAALDSGVGARRLRRSDLVRPIRGFRIAKADDGRVSRCRAYAAHRGTDFAFSHTTAAILYGIPLPRVDRTIHVSVRAPGRAPTIEGFTGHKLGRWEIRTVADLPVTTPEQTWLDLAQLLHRDALVAAGDYLVGGLDPLTDRLALAHAAGAAAGRRGVGRAREAIELVRVGAESPGETRLRLLLTEAALPSPALNHELRTAEGAFVARVDFAFTAERVALEYEGDIHRVDQATWRKDLRRRERVEDLGWRMVRVTADDIAAPAELIRRLRRLLA
jgi:hypothetical protein